MIIIKVPGKVYKICSLGDNSSHSYSYNSSCNFVVKIDMIVGSTKEDLSLERRVALTPET